MLIKTFFRYHEDGAGDVTFADTYIEDVYDNFREPLQNAGMDVTLAEFTEEWHDLVDYTKSYLSPSNTPYKKTWARIFNSTRCKNDYKNVLLLVEVLFCLPVSASICERSFSLLKRTKRDTRASLGPERLENLMRISLHGPPITKFEAGPSMKRWADVTFRRPNQSKRFRTYKTRNSTKKAIGLSSESE